LRHQAAHAAQALTIPSPCKAELKIAGEQFENSQEFSLGRVAHFNILQRYIHGKHVGSLKLV
jgi:hypothetical protein